MSESKGTNVKTCQRMPVCTHTQSHSTRCDTPVLFLEGAAQLRHRCSGFYLGLRTSSDTRLMVASEGASGTTCENKSGHNPRGKCGSVDAVKALAQMFITFVKSSDLKKNLKKIARIFCEDNTTFSLFYIFPLIFPNFNT